MPTCKQCKGKVYWAHISCFVLGGSQGPIFIESVRKRSNCIEVPKLYSELHGVVTAFMTHWVVPSQIWPLPGAGVDSSSGGPCSKSFTARRSLPFGLAAWVCWYARCSLLLTEFCVLLLFLELRECGPRTSHEGVKLPPLPWRHNRDLWLLNQPMWKNISQTLNSIYVICCNIINPIFV